MCTRASKGDWRPCEVRIAADVALFRVPLPETDEIFLDTDVPRQANYALMQAERGFFIRMAIGWALRNYARWNPAFVRTLLGENLAP